MKIKEQKVTEIKKVGKFQAGGPMPGGDPAAQGAPQGDPNAQGGGEDQGQQMMMQIAQQSVQAIQTQDCQLALQVCEALASFLQSQGGGGEGGQPQGEPVFGKGGTLTKRI